MIIKNIKKFKKNIARTLTNIPGWRTNRKIVVFESDDWGSIRIPSSEIKKILLSIGYDIDRCHYMKYDSLASEDDLELLFDLLRSIKSGNGKSPIITANCLVANPDFRKIEENNFQEYYYEEIPNTFGRYPKHKNVIKLWNDGNIENIFRLQSHGREHLNISRWMKDLRNRDSEVNILFNLNTFGLSKHISKRERGSYLAAFDGGEKELIYDRSEIINDALKIFKKIFGYQSLSFISPNFIWDEEIEHSLFSNGIKFIQSQRRRTVSGDYNSKRILKRHYLGQENKYGQKYMVRNCEFEPSSNSNINWVDKCLKEINSAFIMKKPAIISTHRVNFVGFIDETNRDRNLKLFKTLLSEIVRKWAEVEFLSTDELGILLSDGE